MAPTGGGPRYPLSPTCAPNPVLAQVTAKKGRLGPAATPCRPLLAPRAPFNVKNGPAGGSRRPAATDPARIGKIFLACAHLSPDLAPGRKSGIPGGIFGEIGKSDFGAPSRIHGGGPGVPGGAFPGVPAARFGSGSGRTKGLAFDHPRRPAGVKASGKSCSLVARFRVGA